MDGWLQGVLWSIACVTALIVFAAALRSRRPIRNMLSSGVQGLCALGAVNLFGAFAQASLGLSGFTVGISFGLGIPGVISLLLMKLIFPIG